MDDVKARAVEWCELARRLCEAPSDSGPDSLSHRLDAIAAGLLLRRQLDSSGPERRGREAAPRADVRGSPSCKCAPTAKWGRSCPGPRGTTWSHDGREIGWRTSGRPSAASRPALRLDPLHQALAIEGLRTEVEWLSAVIDRLDRETPDPATAWLDVELARLSTSLRVAAGRDSDSSELPLREGCERLQAVLLERRIKRELARSIDESAPGTLWGHRFHLTRLQAQAMTLDLANGQAPLHTRLAAERAGWIDRLDRRRAELALAADLRLMSLPLSDRSAPCERIVQAALDEAGETMAFLEDMSLRRAVDRLKLVGDDLARLSESCLQWPRVEQDRPAASDFPSEIFLPSAGAVDGNRADETEGPERVERGGHSSGEPHERDDRPPKHLRKQAQAVRRANRQVQREWQEKLLALRMEKLFGRRFVAILENTVLFLILVLFGLIVAEAVLERASPRGSRLLSTYSSRGPTWRSARCSSSNSPSSWRLRLTGPVTSFAIS